MKSPINRNKVIDTLANPLRRLSGRQRKDALMALAKITVSEREPKTEAEKIVKMLHRLPMDRLVKFMKRYARRAATALYRGRKFTVFSEHFQSIQLRNISLMRAASREIQLRNIPTDEKVAAHEAAVASRGIYDPAEE